MQLRDTYTCETRITHAGVLGVACIYISEFGKQNWRLVTDYRQSAEQG